LSFQRTLWLSPVVTSLRLQLMKATVLA
jgi:hypothetical protein